MDEPVATESQGDAAVDVWWTRSTTPTAQLIALVLGALRSKTAWHRAAVAWAIRDHWPDEDRAARHPGSFDDVIPAIVAAAHVETDEDARSLLVSAICRTGAPEYEEELLARPRGVGRAPELAVPRGHRVW